MAIGHRPTTAPHPALSRHDGHRQTFNGPPVINNQSFSIAENSANGAVVGTVVATDPDAGETLSYDIVGGNYGDAFAINPATGQLTVATAGMLDYESVPSFTLEVEVYDGSFLVSGFVTVTVTNVVETPTVTSFSPANGNVGTTVTLTGSHFLGAGALTVAFNGTNATGLTINSATSLTATVPTGATTGPISVTNAEGTGTSATNFVVGTVNPPNVVTFSPTSGGIGTSVTVAGYYFTGATSVTFNGTSASYTVNNDGDITAIVPSGASTGPIKVTTPFGMSTSASSFTVQTPIVSSFTPTSAATGSTVAISGFYFSGVTGVTINNVAVPYTVNSTTSITATVPANATTGQIRVTTGTGTGTSAGVFKVLPTLASFAPGSGVIGSTVTLTGSGFTDATSVKFNTTTTTSFTIVNPTTITVAVPAGATNGKIVVTTPGGTATSVNTFTIAPAIASFTPDAGSVGSVVLVLGQNFISPTTVSFNGTAATTTYNSATQLTATVPAGATSGLLTVSNANGSSASASAFTVTAGSPPTLTSFTPTSGAPGTVVTITGTNLGGTTAVRFNTETTTAVTVLSATQVRVTAPAGISSGKLYVITPTGMAQSATSFTVSPAPVISSFTPTSGGSGTSVVITGTTFTGATAVTIGGVAAASYVVNSATQITATVAAGAGTGLVTVTTPSGTGTSAANFTMTPTITSFTPTSGPVGTSVTITGTGLLGATGVSFNGTAAPGFTVNSGTSITAAVPMGATSGTISVTTPGGTVTSSGSFTVTVVAPTITSFTPTSGPAGTSVAITGTNLSGATAVRFNGTAAASFTVNSVTSITATVPAGATTGTISVTTPGGTATSSGSFTMVAAPVISSLSPTSGLQGASVTITGSNFTGTTAVRFNGTAASFTVNSATSITTTVPTGAASGTVSVTNAAGTGTSAGSFTVLHPPVIVAQTFSVAENSANGTVVGTVTATDPDAGQTLTYAITAGNTGGAFAINGATGVVTVANVGVLNFEAIPSFSLTVQVTDNGSPTSSASATVTINLINVNEAPVVSPVTFTLPENTANGTVVGTVTATDPDAGTTLTYSITAGNVGGAFAINGATGQLTVANSAALDFETTPSFSLTVRASDGSLAGTATATVNLTNVNEAPTMGAGSFTLAENSANGTVVGTVTGTDPDAGTTLAYSIIAGNVGGAFAINGATGQLTVANTAALNFEATPVFSLTVRASDGSLSGTATVTVNLTNVNEAPVVTPATFVVAENTANGTVVGTVTATDPDAGTTLTYSITAGNVGGAFAINGATGQLTVTNALALDFESSPTFSLTVRASDGSLSGTATVTINLIDLNEAPFIGDQSFSVAENVAAGTSVGVVAASDPDAGQALTYSIVSGNTGGAFALNSATGELTVAHAALLDYETTPSFSLGVAVSDGSLTAAATVTLTLTDAEEAPAIAAQSFSIAENAGNDAGLGTVVATDPDAGTTLTYAITAGNNGGAFALNGVTGELTVADASALDFETTPTYFLTVEVSDGTLTSSAMITVNLIDVNEAPSVGNLTLSVLEGTPNGTVVGTVLGTDPDAGTTLTYTLTSGNVGGAFALNSATGQLTVANTTAINFATTPTFSLEVEVSDGSLTANSTVTIDVSNVNTAPSVTSANFVVAENPANGTVVGTVVGTDPDAGTTLTYAITAGNTGGAFALNSATGELTVANAALLDYETTPTFSLEVEVSDGALAGSGTVTVNLVDVNEAPVISAATFSVNEGAASGTVVGQVVASDPDAVAMLTYSITAGNAGGAFVINTSTGELLVGNSAAVNFDTNPTFALTVEVSDGSLSAATTVTVNVLDLNQPPVIDAQSFTVLENAANGTNVGTVEASDPDAGQTLTYSITAGNVGGAFALNSATGALTVANSAALDFETTPVFSLTVAISDGMTTSSATITVNLFDLNEAPVVGPLTFAINENSANGTVVGTVLGSDPDGGPVTFSILNGNVGGAFALNATTGQLTVASSAALDYETTPGFALLVQVSDGALTSTATITINLNNLNEPPVVASATFSLAENAANGTTVGTVSAADDGGPVTYSITAGNVGGAFALNSATGVLTVANAAALDYETTPSFALTVQVSDGTLTSTALVTVNLTDVNEAPTMNPATFTLAENSGAGTVVGFVTATDPDAGAQLFYNLTSGNTGGAFTLNSVTGRLTVANPAALDFETMPVISLTIRVSDGSLTSTAMVMVNLTDVNEVPVVSPAIFSLAENTANGTVVGTVAATDPDAGTVLTYSITAGNTGGAFSMAGNQIVVANATALDYEATPTFTMTVQASDGNLTGGATVTVNLTNGIEAPTVTSFSPGSGAVGSTVTITGTNFLGAGAVAVRFNNTLATAVTVASATSLTADVPSGATTGLISVTNADGSAASATNYVIGVIGLPSITSFTPTSGVLGANVTITGKNFIGATVVRFNGVDAAFTVISATSITTNVPAGATTGKLTVVTPGGTALSAGNFTVQIPTVSSFSPSTSATGTTITITGNYFLGASAVYFNGEPAESFTVNSATNISAVVPTDATTGKVSVTTPTGTGLSASIFKVAPTLASFSPGTGVPGDIVTITGSGYTDATSVKFGTVVTTDFTVVDANTIAVEVPATAATGKLSVVTPGGTIASATNFTVGPIISAFTPGQGSPGSVVIITGANFVNPTTVSFNGVAATTTYNSATQLTATVPAGATTGLLSVTNANGTSFSATAFTVTSGAAPTITSFTPTSGAIIGTLVTITGTNFTGSTAVRFNTITTTDVTVLSATQVRAAIPAGATSGKVYVITPNGMAASAGSLAITQPPTITGFTPTSGPVGTVVTITGTVFTGTTAVRFGGVAATSFTVNSTTSISATVPAGALTGTISVTTPGGTATSGGTFTVTAARAALVAAPVAEPVRVELYPNPATDYVTLRVSGGTAEVREAELVDATGRVVQRLPLTDGAVTLPLTGLTKGMYVVRVSGQSHRLLVE